MLPASAGVAMEFCGQFVGNRTTNRQAEAGRKIEDKNMKLRSAGIFLPSIFLPPSLAS